MRAALRDPGLQATFDEQGYVVVPLLDADEVAHLRHEFGRLFPETGFGSHYTSASRDVAYRRAVRDAIAGSFALALAGLLDGYRPVVANFFVKEPGPETSLVVHQDWAFVDEATTRSLNVWCPLEDATVENGTLRVLAGSHRVFDHLRGTSEGAGGLPSPFAGIEERITDDYLVPVPVPAGSAIINDHRLVHSSGANRSDAIRIAASLTLLPVDVPVTHAFGRPDGTVDLYELDDEALLSHRIGEPPAGRLLRSFPYERPPLGLDGLRRLLGPPRASAQ